jgi:phosphate transport system protein
MSIETSGYAPAAFDADRRELTGLIAEMGGYTEKQIVEAIDALSKGDAGHGKRIISADAALDAMQREIERKAIAIMAARRLVAIDVREILGVIRIANSLERIGDRAKNIGKRVIGINGEAVSRRAIRGVQHMAALVLRQLQDVLDSFATHDSVKAFQVWVRDEEIDSMNTSLFRELLETMATDRRVMAYGVHLLFCAKNIERIGDHVTNIAEAVVFMVEGRMLVEERPKADVTSIMPAALNA